MATLDKKALESGKKKIQRVLLPLQEQRGPEFLFKKTRSIVFIGSQPLALYTKAKLETFRPRAQLLKFMMMMLVQ